PAFSSLVITLTLLLSLFSSSIIPRHPSSPLFPYTTLFRSLVGATVQLTTTLKDAAGNVLSGRSVTWASGTPAVATESSTGLVTGVAAGAATITATSEGQSGTAAVTVNLVPVASVTVSPASRSEGRRVGEG